MANLTQNDPPRTTLQEGGLGDLAYPLVADLKKEISTKYGVLTEDGVALRGLFIIDKEGVIQHSTINNLSFGRSVDETKRVLQVRNISITWGESVTACILEVLCNAWHATPCRNEVVPSPHT